MLNVSTSVALTSNRSLDTTRVIASLGLSESPRPEVGEAVIEMLRELLGDVHFAPRAQV
jgi:hypothetical protein